MSTIKLVYYGFGAFIGSICGIVINLIFYWLEQSGNRVITDMVRNYGIIGKFVAEMVHMLPFFGAALGIILVRILFQKELESK